MIESLLLLMLLNTPPAPPVPQAVPVKNPSGIAFTCPDHDRDDQHELDIINEATAQVIGTLLLGDPPLTAGEVIASINVQPIAFGQYRFVVRAVAGTLKSENSLPSDLWERVPGRPSAPIPR